MSCKNNLAESGRKWSRDKVDFCFLISVLIHSNCTSEYIGDAVSFYILVGLFFFYFEFSLILISELYDF